MSEMHKSSILILFLILLVLNSIAQPAYVDSTFNKGSSTPGVFATTFYGKDEEATMIVAQKDEKIVMVGPSPGPSGRNFSFVRINPDGTLDEHFAEQGKGTFAVSDSTHDIPESVAIDAEGRILIGGYMDAYTTNLPVIIRLTSEGIIDKTFGKDGVYIPDFTPKTMRGIHTLKRQGDKILAVGSYVDIVNTFTTETTTIVFRLNEDGTHDKSFGDLGYTALEGMSCFKVDVSERGIALGGSYSYLYKASSILNPVVAMLRPDGTLDKEFGVEGYFKGDFVEPEIISAIAFQKDGNLVTLGDVAGQSVIMRLTASGKIDSEFAYDGRFINPVGFSEKGKSIFALPNGNILAVIEATFYEGNFNSQRLRLVKLDENGGSEQWGYDKVTDFSLSITTSILTSDYKLICARANQLDFSVVKVKTKYTQFIWFDELPRLTLNSGSVELSASSTLDFPVHFRSDNRAVAEVKGQKLFVTGAGSAVITAYVEENIDYEGASQSQIITVTVPAEFLVGKGFTGTKKVQTYSVVPYNDAYSYEWSYSGEGVFLIRMEKDSINSINVYFSDDASDGDLICFVFDDAGLKTQLRKEIHVIKGGVDGNVGETACPESYGLCHATYINAFRINTLKSESSGCQGTGYSDFTESGLTTELYLGNVYTAEFEIGSILQSGKYVGIWIDYNNDGDFEDEDEFVNASFGEDSVLSIKPLVIKSSKEFAGNRRLRVRCRTTGHFTSSDACMLAGETGETEDYMIKLIPQDALEAPEIITPNEDGLNDYFVIRGINDKAGNRLDIFDKWGEIKYSAENYVNDWSGKTNAGEQISEGTYYYVFKNGHNVLKGFVEVKY